MTAMIDSRVDKRVIIDSRADDCTMIDFEIDSEVDFEMIE